MYSCWNQGAGVFDYYEDGRQQASVNAPSPDHIPTRSLGATIDQACWPLPPDAKKVGSGAVAIGRVASKSGGKAVGSIELPSSPIAKAGLLTFAAILAYKYLVKGGKK